jgi:hypothetical protein
VNQLMEISGSFSSVCGSGIRISMKVSGKERDICAGLTLKFYRADAIFPGCCAGAFGTENGEQAFSTQRRKTKDWKLFN